MKDLVGRDIVKVELSKGELEYLLHLLHEKSVGGYYTDNYREYIRRHNNIINILKDKL